MQDLLKAQALELQAFTELNLALDSLLISGKQLRCNHAFTDEYSETTCYKCGLEVNF